MPNRRGGNTVPPGRTLTCCVTKGSTSKRGAARCRPPSSLPGGRAVRSSDPTPNTTPFPATRSKRCRTRRRVRDCTRTRPGTPIPIRCVGAVVVALSGVDRLGAADLLRFFGEPAEKVCGSKPVHAAKGYYDGADAFISYHP